MMGRKSLPNRREALRLLAGASAAGCLPDDLAAQWWKKKKLAAPNPLASGLTRAQDEFLDDLERRGCQYFWEQASASTGQVKDRALAEGTDTHRIASVAATGFGLTALCIADRRKYLSAAEVRERVHRTLDFHLHRMSENHGFFYHFTDVETGARAWKCEVSSIDTAIFLCGALMCRTYFTGTGLEEEIRSYATALYERVDWPWMLTGGKADALTYSMGYKPESGFLESRWSTYSELMMMYLLGIGSPTHPVIPKTWIAFARPYVNYEGFRYLSDLAPLFTHQFSHAWFDLRNKHDRYVDYFQNSITATRANKAFCLGLGAPYSDTYWGITASDSEHGYAAWGGPPAMGRIDGSVVPCATAGSLVFLPQDCLEVLMALKANYPKAWGRYGYVDALHATDQWYDPDVLGIDQGIGVLMAENLRSGFVWKTFMRNPEVTQAMEICGFVRSA